MFKVVGYWYSEHGDGCQHCGKGINHIFIIKDGPAMMRVGSECVKALTDPVDTSNAKMVKRIEAAKRQYAKNQPARRAGEDRSTYVMRRVIEMGNAFRGYSLWIKSCNTDRVRQMQFSMRTVDRILKMNGVVKPADRFSGEAYRYEDLYRALLAHVQQRHAERKLRYVERITQSNRFDFVNRRVWQIRAA